MSIMLNLRNVIMYILDSFIQLAEEVRIVEEQQAVTALEVCNHVTVT